MIRRCTLWTAAVLAVFAVTAAQAAEDVYHAIPSDCWAFVAVNRIAETSAKVQKVGQLVGAPPVGLLDLAKASAGVKKGLDETGSAALVVMPGKNRKNADDAAPVFLIPVADYKTFLASWGAKPSEKEKIVEVKIGGESMLIANRGGYAAISPREYRQALDKFLDAKRSVADECPQLVPWLLENDGIAVATSHGIKMASQGMQKELKQMRETFAHMNEDSAMLITTVTTLEMYVKFLQWAEKDVDVIAAGARIDKEGTVHVATRTRFTKDSSFAATIAKLQASGKSPLLGMPGGQFMAAGGGVWSNSLTQGIVTSLTGLMKQIFGMAYDLDDKKAEELAKTLLDMPKGLRSLSVMIGPGQPGEPILSDMLVLYGVDDAKKYLDEYEKFIGAFDEAGKDGKAASEKKVFAMKKTEVGGRPALETEMSLALSAKIKDTAGFEESIGKFFGPGGKLKTLIVAVDEHTVAISFGDSGPLVMRAIAALKQPSEALAGDADVAKVAAMLPAGSQWVGYVSPSGAVAFVKWVVDTMMPEASYGYKPNIPDFPASPPIGIAVKAMPGELQTETIITTAVLEAIGKYVAIVQSAEHPEVP